MTLLDGHNSHKGRWRRLAVEFSRLAVIALILGLVAVPVTCVDAHGPHSLYAPPDVQASVAAAALSTIPGHPLHHRHHEHGAIGASTALEDATWIAPSSPEEGSRAVVNNVSLAPLASGELTAIAPEQPGQRLLQSRRLLLAEPPLACSQPFDLRESPPPR